MPPGPYGSASASPSGRASLVRYGVRYGVGYHIRLVRYHLCHVTHWRLCHTAMHAPNQCQVCPTARAALNLFHDAKSTMRSEDGICGQHDMPRIELACSAEVEGELNAEAVPCARCSLPLSVCLL